MMRARSMILFIVAIGCGLAASIGVSQYMERAAGSGGIAIETAKIFVALKDVQIGEKLDATNVKLAEWPKNLVPEGAILELAELENRFPRSRLSKDEPILTAKLMDSNTGAASITIPKGFRAVSVKVSVDTTASGLIQPGDKVDLLVSLRKNSEIPATGTHTILHNVTVFSVDGATERSVDETGQARNVRSVSLLVKPKQAETVMLATELGRLSLSLRRPDDETEPASEGESIESLLATNDSGQEAAHPLPGIGGSLLDWLNPPPKPAPAVAPEVALQPIATLSPSVPPEPKWVMKIMGPAGTQEYHWNELDGSPQLAPTAQFGPDLTQATQFRPSAGPALPAPTATFGGLKLDEPPPPPGGSLGEEPVEAGTAPEGGT